MQFEDKRKIVLIAESGLRLPSVWGQLQPRGRFRVRYYDTVDYRLASRGITLQRRAHGNTERWTLASPVAGLEYESEVRGRMKRPPSIFEQLLLAYLRGETLVEVAALRIHRKAVRVTWEGDVADVVVDSITGQAGHSKMARVREITLERVTGHERLLRRLSKALRKTGAERHDGRPLLFRALPISAPGKRETPTSDAPMAQHLSYGLTLQYETLLAHDPGTRLGRDPEQLHRMRVAVRRLRAILRAASLVLTPAWAQPFREDLDWLSVLLGSVRDLDVQIAALQEEAQALDAHDRRPLVRFVQRLKIERQKQHEALLNGLSSERYVNFLDHLEKGVRAPQLIETDVTLKDIAHQQFKKLQKAVRRLGQNPTDAELHGLRIKTKRARYAAELAISIVGTSAAKFVRCAKTFQDVLGQHQDAVIGEQRVRLLFAEAKGRRAAFTAGRIVERHRMRREKIRRKLGRLWKRLEKRGRRAWM